MSIERKYHSEVDAAKLGEGVEVTAHSIYELDPDKFSVVEYLGTHGDGTVVVRARRVIGGEVGMFVWKPGYVVTRNPR